MSAERLKRDIRISEIRVYLGMARITEYPQVAIDVVKPILVDVVNYELPGAGPALLTTLEPPRINDLTVPTLGFKIDLLRLVVGVAFLRYLLRLKFVPACDRTCQCGRCEYRPTDRAGLRTSNAFPVRVINAVSRIARSSFIGGTLPQRTANPRAKGGSAIPNTRRRTLKCASTLLAGNRDCSTFILVHNNELYHQWGKESI